MLITIFNIQHLNSSIIGRAFFNYERTEKSLYLVNFA